MSNSSLLCLQGLHSLSLLQTKLYSRAVQELMGQLPARCEIEAIESGELRKFVLSEKALPAVTTSVNAVAEGIRKRNFQATPSASVCRLCPFKTSCAHACY
jgi:hypothetical protein